MFYSGSILTKGGPLQVVWLAAFNEKRMKKQQALGTSIPDTVDRILKPQDALTASRMALGQALQGSTLDGKQGMPMALRLSGQLLLGVVRVYKEQMGYLAEDAVNALCNMQVNLAVRVLPDEGPTDAAVAVTAADARAKPTDGNQAGAGASAALTPGPAPTSKPGKAAAARIQLHMQQAAHLEELVRHLGAIDEDAAFLDGGDGFVLDLLVSKDSAGTGRDKDVSSEPPVTPLPLLRRMGSQANASHGAVTIARLGSANVNHSVLVRRASATGPQVTSDTGAGFPSLGIPSLGCSLGDTEEMFEDWGPAIRLDLDAPNDDAWLLEQSQVAREPSNHVEGARGDAYGDDDADMGMDDGGGGDSGDGLMHQRQHSPASPSKDPSRSQQTGAAETAAMAVAAVGEAVVAVGPGSPPGEWSSGGGGTDDGDGAASEDAEQLPLKVSANLTDQPLDTGLGSAAAGGPPVVSGDDDEEEEEMEGGYDTAGEGQPEDWDDAGVVRQAEQHKTHTTAKEYVSGVLAGLGAGVYGPASMAALLDTHQSRGPVLSSTANPTILSTEQVRSLLQDRTQLMHPHKSHMLAAVRGKAVGTKDSQGSTQQQHQKQGGVLSRDVLLQQSRVRHNPTVCALIASCSDQGAVSPWMIQRLNQLLQPNLQRSAGAVMSCMMPEPVYTKPAAAPSQPNKHSHGLMLDYVYNMAPYMLMPTVQPEQEESQGISRLQQDNPTTQRLSHWLSASGLLPVRPHALCPLLADMVAHVQLPGYHTAQQVGIPASAAPTAAPAKAAATKTGNRQSGGGAQSTAAAPGGAAAARGSAQQPGAAVPTIDPDLAGERALHEAGEPSTAGGGDDDEASRQDEQQGPGVAEGGDGVDDHPDGPDERMSDDGPGGGDDEAGSEDLVHPEADNNDDDDDDQQQKQKQVESEAGEDALTLGAPGVHHASAHAAPAADGFTARTRSLLSRLQQLVQEGVGQEDGEAEEEPAAKSRRLCEASPSAPSRVCVSVQQHVVPVLVSESRQGSHARKPTPRMTCARMFVDLLVLQNRGYITLQQKQPLQDMAVHPRDKLLAQLPATVTPAPAAHISPAAGEVHATQHADHQVSQPSASKKRGRVSKQ